MSARVIEACEALLRLDAEHDGFVGSLPGDFGPTLAREYLKLAAVVAVQREALEQIDVFCVTHLPFASEKSEVIARRVSQRARAALDAEGVSESGETLGREKRLPGSLTSPVDTAREQTCATCHGLGAVIGRRGVKEPCPTCEGSGFLRAPRGYVEHGPDGPQAVYHAETPDAYLEHGDRP